MIRTLLPPILLLATLSACVASIAKSDLREVDIAILDGLVVDGTGAPGKVNDILVKGGDIVFVGDADEHDLQARRTINAVGRVVTPGFIDLHSHGNPLVDQSFSNFLLQGVTTVVLGQDGRSAQVAGVEGEAPPNIAFSDWITAVDRKALDVNVAALTGFGTIRKSAGVDDSPMPTSSQLAAAKAMLRADMEAGAFGMSSGLEYIPDRYSETSELVALAEVVGAYDGVVMSHMRTEDDVAIAGAIDELAAQGKKARVNISHVKIVFGKSADQAEAVLAQIRKMRANGIEMSADVYPYVAGFANMELLYPPWAKRKAEWHAAVRDRRPELEAYLHDRMLKRNGPEALLIASGPYAGMTLKQIAEKERKSFVDIIIDVFGYGGPDAAHRIMSPEVQDAFVVAPDVAISTDGGPGIRHPRSWGTYPKVLREFVVESRRMSVETAIYKMTGLPAGVLGLSDRGRIGVGANADLLVIDMGRVRDTATWVKHDQVPEGFDAIIVNGAISAERGRQLPGRHGQLLRRISRGNAAPTDTQELSCNSGPAFRADVQPYGNPTHRRTDNQQRDTSCLSNSVRRSNHHNEYPYNSN